MNIQQCRQDLIKALQEETEHAKALVSLLDIESELVTDNAEKLIQLNQDKQILLDQLETDCHKRLSVLQQYGFSADLNGMQDCIARCDDDNHLAQMWGDYKNIIQNCRQSNARNGMITDNSLRNVKRALEILYGRNSSDNTYDAKGSERHGSLGRSIAKA